MILILIPDSRFFNSGPDINIFLFIKVDVKHKIKGYIDDNNRSKYRTLILTNKNEYRLEMEQIGTNGTKEYGTNLNIFYSQKITQI